MHGVEVVFDVLELSLEPNHDWVVRVTDGLLWTVAESECKTQLVHGVTFTPDPSNGRFAVKMASS